MRLNKRGFTLVELLLYIAMVPLILGGAIGLFYLSTQSRIKHETVSEVQKQGSQIVNIIAREIQAASGITTPVAGSNGPSLELSTSVAATNPTLFNIGGTTLFETEGLSPAIELHNSKITISNLDFVNLSRPSTNGNVKFSFDLTSVNSSGRNEYDYTQTFYGSGSLRP